MNVCSPCSGPDSADPGKSQQDNQLDCPYLLGSSGQWDRRLQWLDEWLPLDTVSCWALWDCRKGHLMYSRSRHHMGLRGWLDCQLEYNFFI